MQKQNVEQIIRELASENFYSYRSDYPISNGSYEIDSFDAIKQLGECYWDNRQDLEIERDAQLYITAKDYKDWVFSSFVEKLQDSDIYYNSFDLNKFKSVNCKNLLDFQENAEIGQSWQDKQGNIHYKVQRDSEPVSFYRDEKGECFED